MQTIFSYSALFDRTSKVVMKVFYGTVDMARLISVLNAPVKNVGHA
jgi:hypothetical protein